MAGVSPLIAEVVEVLLKGGDIIYSIQEYLHHFWTKFEHELTLGGGSGDSGGIFLIPSAVR
jgi:hypothetical protein